MKKDLSYNMADRVVRLAGAFIISIYAARELGLSDFGEFSTALAIKAVCLVIISLGLNSLSIRVFSSVEKKCSQEIVRKLLVKKYVISLAFILMFCLFVEMDLVYVLSIVLCALIFPFITLELYFKSVSKTHIVFFSTVATYTLILMLISAKVLLFIEIDLIPFLLIADPLVFVVLLGLCYVLEERPEQQESNNNNVDDSLFDSRAIFPLAVSAIGAVLLSKGDVLVASYMISDAAAGVVSVASRMNTMFFLPILAGQQILLNMAANMSDYDVNALYRRLFIIVVGYCGIISLFFYYFGEDLLVLLFGNEMAAAAADYLLYYSFTNVLFMFPIISAFWYYHYSLQVFVSYKNLIALLIFILASIIGTYFHGLNGLIVAFAIAGCYVCIVGDFFNSTASAQRRNSIRIGEYNS